jgi:2-polyprenyl-3-methyl-5-hydroxy-6-metoxy-1,4-benzoquinol methylase
MLTGFDDVLEIGCGDGFGTALVSEVVKPIKAIDLDSRQIEQNIETNPYAKKIEFLKHDILGGPVDVKCDAVFSLDVLEHIEKEYEFRFITNITASLKSDGVCILSMPSLEGQAYASPLSKICHVNCKTGDEFKNLMEKFFRRVFIFSMNDEVLHTGFHSMSHYLIALCVSPIKSKPITVDP